MSFRPFRQRAVILALPLLAACASVTPPVSRAPVPSPAQPAAPRSFHEGIDLSGRLSVHYQRYDREEALHGSFIWNQTASQTTVTLLSPLGQTIAIITVTPDGATLQQSGQEARSAADVNTLTAQTLGWPLPVDGLRDWLQGFAVGRSGKRVVATPQIKNITTIDGWRIHYASWEIDEPPGAPEHPKRIDLARTTEQAGDVSIRIVIDTWQAH